MNWINEPTSWQLDGSALTVKSDPKTDFWRLTHDGGIRDNGHFYYQSVNSDFSSQVIVTGQYQEQYDQSGLMIRLSESEWIKCGVEFVNGKPFVSAVVTRNTSDWSKLPAPSASSLTFRIQRTQDLVEIFYGTTTADLQLFRQTTFTSQNPLQVGLMTASPLGSGFTTLFSDWKTED